MKRFFVIEVDTEFYAVPVREVTRSFEADEVRYSHHPTQGTEIYDLPSPKFYGQLDALLVTKSKVKEAEPITPESEEAPCNTQK